MLRGCGGDSVSKSRGHLRAVWLGERAEVRSQMVLNPVVVHRGQGSKVKVQSSIHQRGR